MLFLLICFLFSQIPSLASKIACGYQGTFNKIIGGRLTEIDEFPWLVRLEYLYHKNESAGFLCSGSLIDKQVVLTAGHCISYMQSLNFSLYRVRLGEYDTSSEIDCVNFMGVLDCAYPHQDIEVLKYVIHPQYLGGYSDIALIFLKTEAVYSDFVRPICLPQKDRKIKVGQRCLISGWGTKYGGVHSDTKLKTEIPITGFDSCYLRYLIFENTTLNTRRHICAGGLIYSDTCRGDSGTPLMLPTKGGEIWMVLGITSLGKVCGTSNWPGVYTNVRFYVGWIKNEIIKFKRGHVLKKKTVGLRPH